VHSLRVDRGSNAKFAKVAKKIHLGVLRVLGVLVLFVACSGGTGLFKQYEYEEEMYLSLDGTATLYVNSSLAAMNALRGTAFDTSAARIDREAVRRYFTTPSTRVARVTESQRSGRRFLHVRLEVDDIRKLVPQRHSPGRRTRWSGRASNTSTSKRSVRPRQKTSAMSAGTARS
jgi:hypothetical protein